jgi:hypothetical protein
LELVLLVADLPFEDNERVLSSFRNLKDLFTSWRQF